MSFINVIKECQAAVIFLNLKRLDASIAPVFKQEILKLIEAGENKIVLDLNAVEFIDSSGLGALVSILKALGSGGSIVICNARVGVLGLFRLTRMDKVFSILPSREEAITKIST